MVGTLTIIGCALRRGVVLLGGVLVSGERGAGYKELYDLVRGDIVRRIRNSEFDLSYDDACVVAESAASCVAFDASALAKAWRRVLVEGEGL